MRPSGAEQARSMTVYTDEISPGNKLKLTISRKVHGFYVTCDELGTEARARESLSWCLCIAQAERRLSAPTHALATSNPSNLWGVATCERWPAVRDACCRKAVNYAGASGNLPCPLCSNIISRISAAEHHVVTGTLRSISCTEPNDFVLRTDAEIFQARGFRPGRTILGWNNPWVSILSAMDSWHIDPCH